jgi:hypothetical protein
VGPHESMTCGIHGIYLKFGSLNGIDLFSCALFAWRRGEKAKEWMRRAAIAGGEGGSRSKEASLAHAGVAAPQIEEGPGAPGARRYIATPRRRPRGGVRRVDAWPPARPRISTASPTLSLPCARLGQRQVRDTPSWLSRLQATASFFFSLGGSGHGFHASTGVNDPATRQSFLQCSATTEAKPKLELES